MTDKGTNKFTIIALIGIIIVLVAVLIVVIVQENIERSQISPSESDGKRQEQVDVGGTNKNISVLPTMQDEVSDNSAWCGTFQLAWNDLQDNLVGGDVKFETSNKFVENLNKQTFTEASIPEEYYYKNWGVRNLSLKKEIEKGIKDKFNETSDILDLFSWPENDEDVGENEYFFYSMLRRDFEFEKEFTILEKNKFANTENVEYFGINSETNEQVRNQVEVLYYTNKNDFAVILYTKEDDQVMLVRNPEGDSFEKIYENVNKKYEKDRGSKTFGKEDTLSVPNLNIDELKEFTELEHNPFKVKDGSTAIIDQAYQTIKMKLDNKGGSIKSEAGIGTKAMAMLEEDEPRKFNFNDEFAIFLVNNNEPYFAAKISDIKLFTK